MPNPLDLTFHVPGEGENAGKAPRGVARLVARNLAERAGQDARIRVTLPVRTPQQHNAYWLYLDLVSKAYHDAGFQYPKELLHRWFKIRFLPIVSATLLAETGEDVEYERVDEYPDGTRVEREHTTQRLSKAAFSLYVELIMADDEVAAFGIPFPSVEGMRNGRIYEPEELA